MPGDPLTPLAIRKPKGDFVGSPLAGALAERAQARWPPMHRHGFVGVYRDAAEIDFGFAARIGLLAEGLTLTMTAFVEREWKNRADAILDRVDFDFVLSIGENDGLAHDFGWVVNRVSCRPFGAAHLVRGTRI